MKVLLYIALATGMFYFTDGAFQVGGFGFMYMYLFGIGIAFVGGCAFLVNPNAKRFVLLSKYSYHFSLSYLFLVLVSSLIWAFTFAGFRVMTRGFFFVVYQMIALVVAAVTLYLFGSKGIWYCLFSMCLANGIIVFQTARAGGFALFFEELRNLILTFGEDTGTMMGNVEVHDLTFSFGPFMVYLLLNRKDIHRWFLSFLAVLLFLIIGLKRIEIAAILLAVVVCAIVRKVSKKNLKTAIAFLGVALVVVGFIYIILIHSGLFSYLEDVLHIDTKGRRDIYRYLNTQYELNPFYIGTGLGSERIEWEQVGNVWDRIQQDAYHNEFLRVYIEVGCIPFFIWGWLHFGHRLRYFANKQDNMGGILFLGYTLYLYGTYLTDNTLYYYYTNLVVFLLTMSYKLESIEKEELRQYER